MNQHQERYLLMLREAAVGKWTVVACGRWDHVGRRGKTRTKSAVVRRMANIADGLTVVARRVGMSIETQLMENDFVLVVEARRLEDCDARA